MAVSEEARLTGNTKKSVDAHFTTRACSCFASWKQHNSSQDDSSHCNDKTLAVPLSIHNIVGGCSEVWQVDEQ